MLRLHFERDGNLGTLSRDLRVWRWGSGGFGVEAKAKGDALRKRRSLKSFLVRMGACNI